MHILSVIHAYTEIADIQCTLQSDCSAGLHSCSMTLCSKTILTASTYSFTVKMHPLCPCLTSHLYNFPDRPDHSQIFCFSLATPKLFQLCFLSCCLLLNTYPEPRSCSSVLDPLAEDWVWCRKGPSVPVVAC